MNKEEKQQEITKQQDELDSLIANQEKVIEKLLESQSFIQQQQTEVLAQEQYKLDTLKLKLQAFEEFKIQ